MRIAFVIGDYSPSRGGQERYLARLAGALAGKGHEVHVFAAGGEAGDGVRLHRVPVPARAGRTLRTLLFIRNARRMIAPGGFDIVSGFTRYYPLDVYRLGSGLHRVWLRKRADGAWGRLTPFLRPVTWLNLRLERAIFDPRNCRRIIANSELCRRQLAALYGYPEDRVTVVYNGVDHDLFNPCLRERRSGTRRALGLPPDAPVALFVSNNLKRKGLDAAIRALAAPGAGEVRLLVVGKGRTEPFASLAARAGAGARVVFAGRAAEMGPLYGASDYLVLPTRYDPFANVVLEAMACGLPVVTTPDNGASEIVGEGVSGFIVPGPPRTAELGAAMAALADADRRAPMADAARRASLAFTIGRNAEETLRVYERAMEERHAHVS